MLISREQAIAWWLSEPEIEPVPEGTVLLQTHRPCFPPIEDWVTAEEKTALKQLLAKHPEYMSEVLTWGPIQ